LVTRGDALDTEETFRAPGEVHGIAEGVPLGTTYVPLPIAFARPVNRALGALARRLRGSRARLGGFAEAGWRVARRVPGVERARRRAQPYRIEPLSEGDVERIAAILRRSNRRPT